MPGTNTLPEEIIETSRAFTRSLEMENLVFQGQLNSAIGMTINAFQELIAICKEAVALGKAGAAGGQQDLADAARKALSDVQNAASQAKKAPAEAVPAAEEQLDTAVLNAIARSYQNAVTAQQQAYILQQAAATQIIATILSVATATLGIAVKEAEGGGN